MKVWAIEYTNHSGENMWGFFSREFLKGNMAIFHTIRDPVYMELPPLGTLNESFPVLHTRSSTQNEFVTKEKKIKFLRDNHDDVLRYIYKPYDKGDIGLTTFIKKARKEISYSDGTGSADILFSLRTMYNSLNSTQHTNEKSTI